MGPTLLSLDDEHHAVRRCRTNASARTARGSTWRAFPSRVVNFKNAVAARQGAARARVYGEVWAFSFACSDRRESAGRDGTV
jgi:hypothetical protein